ncbi:MAG: GntR family transcriptional regulator, partial [Phycicoccus sp.]
RAPQLHREESVLRSFTDDMRGRGIAPSSRLLRGEVSRLPDQAVALGLPRNAAVVVVERVRMADGVPVALERAVLPGEFASVLDADLEQGSLHQVLAEAGRELGRASGQVTARIAAPQEARLLDVESPAALLVETRLVRDLSGRAVESTQTAYVASRWVLDTGSFVAPVRPRVGEQGARPRRVR